MSSWDEANFQSRICVRSASSSLIRRYGTLPCRTHHVAQATIIALLIRANKSVKPPRLCKLLSSILSIHSCSCASSSPSVGCKWLAYPCTCSNIVGIWQRLPCCLILMIKSDGRRWMVRGERYKKQWTGISELNYHLLGSTKWAFVPVERTERPWITIICFRLCRGTTSEPHSNGRRDDGTRLPRPLSTTLSVAISNRFLH